MTKKKAVKAVVLAQSDDGKTAVIAREAAGGVDVGVVTRPEDGESLDQNKELIQLTADGEGAYDVETVYRPATSSGRVSSKPLTKAYTQNWDNIFAKKPDGASQVLN